MELRALFLFFLSVWIHDVSGRTPEGVLTQEIAWRSPERVKRSLGTQERNQGYEPPGRGSAIADARRAALTPRAEGGAVDVPPPVASPSPRPFTRLVPAFTPSVFARAPGGVSGLYLPPTAEPPTIAPTEAPTEPLTPAHALPESIIFLPSLPCPNPCEFRSSSGNCDVDAACLFE